MSLRAVSAAARELFKSAIRLYIYIYIYIYIFIYISQLPTPLLDDGRVFARRTSGSTCTPAPSSMTPSVKKPALKFRSNFVELALKFQTLEGKKNQSRRERARFGPESPFPTTRLFATERKGPWNLDSQHTVDTVFEQSGSRAKAFPQNSEIRACFGSRPRNDSDIPK